MHSQGLVVGQTDFDITLEQRAKSDRNGACTVHIKHKTLCRVKSGHCLVPCENNAGSSRNPRNGELRMQKLKVPSDENTEHKGFPFKAWSKSVHSCTFYMPHLLPGISS